MWSRLKTAWSAVKNVASSAWSVVVKPFVLPSGITVGRILSACGSALFMIPKFNKWLNKEEESDLVTKLSYGVIVATLIVQFATRIPKIWRSFRKPAVAIPPARPVELLNDEENIGLNVENQNSDDHLGRVGTSIYNALRILSWASAFMTLPNNYLNGVTLFEFGLKQFSIDPKAPDLEYYKIGFATYIACTTFANYIIFTVSSSQKNALEFAKAIDKRDIPLTKAAFATLAISASSFITVPCQATFSTKSALETVLSKFSAYAVTKLVINGFSYFSGLSAFVSQVTTQPPSVYRVLHQDSYSKNQHVETPCWISLGKGIVYPAGLYSDGGIYGLSGFASIANIADAHGINSHSAIFITFNATCSVFSSILYFSFSVVGGWRDTIEPFIKRTPSDPETLLLAREEIDDDEFNVSFSSGAGNVPLLDNEFLASISRNIAPPPQQEASLISFTSVQAEDSKDLQGRTKSLRSEEESNHSSARLLANTGTQRVSSRSTRRSERFYTTQSNLLMFNSVQYEQQIRAQNQDPLVLGFKNMD